MDADHTPAGRLNSWTRGISGMRRVASHQRVRLLALVLFLSVGASGVFVDLAEDVETAAHITVVDLQWADWLHAHATPAMTRVMLEVSMLHDMLSMTVLTILLAIFLASRHQRDWLLGLVLVVPGGMAINTMFKFAFARARPHFIDPIVTLTSYSFPSGHVAGSTLFYGFVVALLVSHTTSKVLHVAAVVAAFLMVVLVAASRMYLGAHFFSDVLAAFFESIAWLGICLVGFQLVRWRVATPPGATR